MKELSIEEKAQRYDEALEMAKKLIENEETNVPVFYVNNIKDIFPELKESIDERIKKVIKQVLSESTTEKDECYLDNGVTQQEVLAWLEKQGEQPKKHDVCDNCDQQGSCVSPCPMKLVEKHGEQKPAWSIPEFKEGDILYNKDSYSSDSIFIFKGMSDKTNAYLCYARLYDGKDFSVYSKENWDKGVGVCGGEFYPANHKQKELLFSEIEKAGYKWNPDKKKMEKIEQKPAAWSKEDERILFCTISDLKFLRDIISKDPKYAVNIIDKEREINWLKSIKDRVQPKQEWSEEDESRMDNLYHFLEEYGNQYYGHLTLQGTISWLKSLRPQNHNKWHSIDEKPVYPCNILYKAPNGNIFLFKYMEDGKPVGPETSYLHSFDDGEWMYLKDIESQSHWKPSDEQMDALRYVTNFDYGGYKATLVSLYEQLKKLREE